MRPIHQSPISKSFDRRLAEDPSYSTDDDGREEFQSRGQIRHRTNAIDGTFYSKPNNPF